MLSMMTMSTWIEGPVSAALVVVRLTGLHSRDTARNISMRCARLIGAGVKSILSV
jgi:hypothetical protein